MTTPNAIETASISASSITTSNSSRKRKSFPIAGSPYSSVVTSFLSAKKKRKQVTECTGCNRRVDAEIFHPVLKVPICGACAASVKNRDKFVFEKNEVSCIWCGFSDGNELLMCDTCKFTFCTSCVARNLGTSVMHEVRESEFWSCFHCSPTPAYEAVQNRHQGILYSLETVYSMIRPPVAFEQQQVPEEYINALKLRGEQAFASLFCPEIMTAQYYQLQIPQKYLSGADIFRVVYCLSKSLRKLFQYKVFVTPGLFQTAYGEEYHCTLHRHQLTSLHTMLAIENKTTEFDALRGGIFADEPGLGKTVTVLALISSTLGRMPNQPAQFWDKQLIEGQWNALPVPDRVKLILPLINKIIKNASYYARADALESLRKQLDNRVTTITAFQADVIAAIKEMPIPQRSHHQLVLFFEHGMNEVKNGLDSKQRHYQKSHQAKRLQYERSLFPSAATLIIVPLALLEHWYEQILRHLNLSYLSLDTEDQRGIVYLDGLGDIVDIEAPISKLAINSSVSTRSIETSPQILANYLIVVTTMERCVIEQNTQIITSTHFSNLQQIRWLRLIVDEGHDLAKLPSRSLPSSSSGAAAANSSSSTGSEAHENRISSRDDSLLATRYISTLAAERRWIMSGTPTTGAFSDIGLMQLFYLLCFLRHPQYCNNGTHNITDRASMEKAEKAWISEIVRPCMEQEVEAWAKVTNLLREIMVRHTKDNIELFPPIYKNVNLLPLYSNEDDEQVRLRAEDRSKAKYIMDTLLDAKKKYRQFLKKHPNFVVSSTAQSTLRNLGSADYDQMSEQERNLVLCSRRPKAIVFSQYDDDLGGVGHFLYLLLGDSAVCEHFGAYQSSELSRFRNSKRKYRICPLCGHQNPITAERHCEKILYLVEYLHQDPVEPGEEVPIPDPAPAGHGAFGPGGHYVGRCLCSPIGCVGPCNGYVNPLYGYHIGINMVNPNFAIIAPEHVLGWMPGRELPIGQTIFVRHAEPIPADANPPVLWSQGRLGGQAVIRAFRKCGGNNLSVSWHGNRVMQEIPWIIEEEDTMILLLKKEGSTGLDLSFATHIFLLERIQDPALRNQIISRAHRFGATGPVHVQLLQVIAEEEEANYQLSSSTKWTHPLIQPQLNHRSSATIIAENEPDYFQVEGNNNNNNNNNNDEEDDINMVD